MATLAAIALLGAGVVGLLVWQNGRVTERRAEQWAGSRGLALTPGNRGAVTWYLHTAGLLRGIGFFAGLLLPALWFWALDLDLGGSALTPWSWAFLGYLVGALYAEISLRRPRGTRAAASPRRLRDYLPPSLRLGQVLLGALLVLLAAGAALAPGSTDVHGRTALPLVVAGGVGLFGTPALVAVELWLLRRPQPVVSPDQVAADDAIRSQSIQSVAASGVAVQLSVLWIPLWASATSDVQILRWTMWVPAWLSFPMALVVGLNAGHLGWRVRRRLPRTVVEAPPC